MKIYQIIKNTLRGRTSIKLNKNWERNKNKWKTRHSIFLIGQWLHSEHTTNLNRVWSQLLHISEGWLYRTCLTSDKRVLNCNYMSLDLVIPFECHLFCRLPTDTNWYCCGCYCYTLKNKHHYIMFNSLILPSRLAVTYFSDLLQGHSSCSLVSWWQYA